MGKAWTITDARGKSVELWHGGGPETVLADLSSTERARFSDIVWPGQSGFTRTTIRAMLRYLAVVIAASIALALLYNLLAPSAWPRFLVGVFVAVPISVGSVIFLHWQVRKVQRNPEYIEAMIGVRRCPACVYSLQGLDAEPDGCIVCPECGGAWQRTGIAE